MHGLILTFIEVKSMGINNNVDYANALSKEREYFQDQLARNRESFQKQADNSDRAHQTTQKQAQKNYMASKNDIEKDLANGMERARENAKKLVRSKNENYQKRLKQNQDDFHSKTENQLKDYSKRLGDIRSSYNEDLVNSKKSNSEMRKTLKNNHEKLVGGLRREQEGEMGRLIKHSIGENANLRDRMTEQQRDQQKEHFKTTDKLKKDHSLERNAQNYKIKREFDSLRDAHAYEKTRVKEDTRDKIDNIKTAQNNEFKGLHETYDDVNKKTQEERIKDSIQMNRQMSEALTEQQKRHGKDLFDIKMKQRDYTGANSRLKQLGKDMQLAEYEKSRANQVGTLKKQIHDINDQFTQDTKKAQETYGDSLRMRRVANADKLLSQELDHNEHMSKSKAAITKEKDDAVHSYRMRYADLKKHNGSIEANNKNKAKKYLETEKKAHHKVVSFINDKHQKELENIQKRVKQDRSEFISKVKREKSEDYHRVKNDFRNKIMAEKEVSEKIQNSLVIKNQDLESDLLTTKDMERERANRKIREQSDLFTKQRDEDFRTMKELMKTREHELRQLMQQKEHKNDMSMQKLTKDNHRKVKRLTSNYEDKFTSMIREFNIKLRQKDNDNNRDVVRMKREWDDYTKRLITQYENQISTIRQSYDAQLEKANTRIHHIEKTEA